MTLAVVRSIDSPRALATAADVEDFEQEIVDQHALAMVGAGLTDGYIDAESVGGHRVRPLPRRARCGRRRAMTLTGT